jgi:hypothetical protein
MSGKSSGDVERFGERLPRNWTASSTPAQALQQWSSAEGCSSEADSGCSASSSSPIAVADALMDRAASRPAGREGEARRTGSGPSSAAIP